MTEVCTTAFTQDALSAWRRFADALIGSIGTPLDAVSGTGRTNTAKAAQAPPIFSKIFASFSSSVAAVNGLTT